MTIDKNISPNKSLAISTLIKLCSILFIIDSSDDESEVYKYYDSELLPKFNSYVTYLGDKTDKDSILNAISHVYGIKGLEKYF